MIRPGAIAERFADGDYMSVALHGTPDQWQYFAARGLITHPLDAIRALERFDDPDARFYGAVLSWMAGKEDDACRQWERMTNAHARNMLALVRKPKIDAISMLPPLRHGAFVLAEGITHDPKFRVRNLGRLPGDIPTRINARVGEFVDPSTPPDFFVCNMIEWHQIPTDIGSIACPTIGFTNDFDLHIQGLHRWCHAFDHMVVIDQVVEHPAIRQISGGPTYAYPMVFGIPLDLPNRPARERDIDVFMSGTMLSAYHPDKARLMHQLLAIDGIKMLIVDGHLGHNNYWDLLARSKITPSFCRHPGGIQTRVMESLSLGSISLVQPESIMQLWVGEREGLFVFDENVGPEPQIRRILANFDDYSASCRANASKFLSAFDPKTIASRFFRFCTFLAARPRGIRDLNQHELLSQKRVMFVHGPRLNADDASSLADENSKRLAELNRTRPSAELLNAVAREWMLLYADGSYYGEAELTNFEFLRLAIEHGRNAMAAFPNSLVARFNLARSLFHFGSTAEIKEATNLARETLTERPDRWLIDPAEDVYPYDFFAEWFNYRRYLDVVVDMLAGRSTDTAVLRDVLFASLHHYLGVVEASLADAERAHRLDPEFPIYALTCGEMLAHDSATMNQDRAVDILVRLAGSSMVARRAYHQLRAIEEHRRRRIRAVAALDVPQSRVSATFLQTEHHAYKLFAPYFIFDNLRPGGRHGAIVHKEHDTAARPRLSFVVCGRAGVGCEELLQRLARQHGDRKAFEIVYVDCFGKPRPTVIEAADTVLSFDQRQFLENRSIAIKAALDHVRGNIVVFVEPGTSLAPSQLERLDAVFYGSGLAQGSDTPRSVPQAIVVVAADAGGTGQLGFLAARTADVLAAHGCSPHELFLGDAPIMEELLGRLIRGGARLQVDGGSADQPLLRWWQSGWFASAPHMVEIARQVWPSVFDEQRITPAGDLPPVHVDTVNSNNIARIYNRYFVIPQALGPVNLEDLRERQRPGIQMARSLVEARALASGSSREPIQIEAINSHNILRVGDLYLVAPQSLGAIDLDDPAQRARAGVLTTETLTAARALASGTAPPSASKPQIHPPPRLRDRLTALAGHVVRTFRG